MGVHFFPTAYEDEILYSIIGRYHKYSGNPGYNLSLHDLFGSLKACPSLELQSNLDNLVSNLPVGSKLTAEDLLFKNTMFPFYAAYVPMKRSKVSISIIKKGNLSSAYAKLGIIANKKSNTGSFLWHCDLCMKEDFEKYGETFWRRSHQIPNLPVCTYHQKPLFQSNESILSKNRQKIVVPEKDSIDWKVIHIEERMIEKMLVLAHKAQSILEKEYAFNDPDYTKHIYMNGLFDKGLAFGSGMIRQKDLKEKIISYWGDELLKKVGLWFNISDTDTWVEKITRGNKVIVNPLAHILISSVLNVSIIDCLNERIEIKDSISSWEDKVVESVMEGLSLREIAKKHRTTRKTIMTLLEKRKIDITFRFNGGGAKGHYIESDKFQKKNEEMRAKCKNVIIENPSISQIKFKKEYNSLFSWMKKYDGEWFSENIILKLKCPVSNTDLWETRDKKFYPEVVKVVCEMKKGKPVRITYNSVGGVLGIRSYLYSRNMRKTTAFLNSEVEEYEEFWIRSIKWALQELEAKSLFLSKWEIIELSGVNLKYFEKVKDRIPELKGL